MAIVAVAATIEELEWKCNETLEIVSQWMKEHGLKLAQEKSKLVLVTTRKKFEYPKLVPDGNTIQFQDSIWYLGLWIDRHWNFKDHIRRTSTKAGNVGTALQQLMPNVEGPKRSSRALLATVVNSVLLYGSPLCGAHAHNSAVIKNMTPERIAPLSIQLSVDTAPYHWAQHCFLQEWLRYGYSLRKEPTCGLRRLLVQV